MQHKIGVHVSAQQRNNYGHSAPHLVAVTTFDSGAFDEVPAECIKIFRTHAIANHKDAPGDFDRRKDEELRGDGIWWWNTHLEPIYRKVREQYGENVYFQPTNEINNPRILLYLDGVIEAAEADGYRLALLGDAGDSPQLDLWLNQWLPWLKKHDNGKHIYVRHAYSGVNPGEGSAEPSRYLTIKANKITPSDNNTARPFIEATMMRDHGVKMPMVITELGWLAGWNNLPSEWLPDLLNYNALMMEHANIAGCCLWNAGQWETAPNILSGKPLLDLGNKLATMTPKFYDENELPAVVNPEPEPKENQFKEFNYVARSILFPQDVPAATLATSEAWRSIHESTSQNRNDRFWSHHGAVSSLIAAKLGGSNDVKLIIFGNRPEAVAMARRWDIPLEVRERPDGGQDPPIDFEPQEFKFEYWPTQHKTITQPYGVNPEYYSKFGLDGHEGIDIRAPHGTPIFAVAAGTVRMVNDSRHKKMPNGTGHNYGVHVRIDHADGYRTLYAHFDSRAVNAGDTVEAGQLIGRADNTGNSFGSHLHFNLYKDGKRIDPTPFLDKNLPFSKKFDTDPTEKPTGNRIDLLEYMFGPNGTQYMFENFDTAGKGRGQERYRMELHDGTGFYVKNYQYEKYHFDDIWIYQDTDTSPGNDQFYTVRRSPDSDELVPRCPRFMREGQEWWGKPHHAQFYFKRTCSKVPAVINPSSGEATNYAKLISVGSWLSPLGTRFDNCVVLMLGKEKQVWQKGVGPVGWQSKWGSAEKVGGLITNQAPMARESGGCF